jgi:hypothetical protein
MPTPAVRLPEQRRLRDWPLPALLEGLDREEAERLLDSVPPAQRPKTLDYVDLDDLGNLDASGVPEWFPRTHPSTGARLSTSSRRRWFLDALRDQLLNERPEDLPLPEEWLAGALPRRATPTRRSAASPPSDLSRRRRYAVLLALLSTRYATQSELLPTPE